MVEGGSQKKPAVWLKTLTVGISACFCYLNIRYSRFQLQATPQHSHLERKAQKALVKRTRLMPDTMHAVLTETDQSSSSSISNECIYSNILEYISSLTIKIPEPSIPHAHPIALPPPVCVCRRKYM